MAEQFRIGLGVQVVLERVKQPQRRIGRVVFGASPGPEIDWQHAAIDEGGRFSTLRRLLHRPKTVGAPAGQSSCRGPSPRTRDSRQ